MWFQRDDERGTDMAAPTDPDQTTDATTGKLHPRRRRQHTPVDKAAACDALALELRQLAELVESTRATLVNASDPAAPEVLAELRIAHERLDESGRAVMPLIGECRRTTYTVLYEQDMTHRQIADAFGLSEAAVWNVIAGRRSAAKKKRKTAGGDNR